MDNNIAGRMTTETRCERGKDCGLPNVHCRAPECFAAPSPEAGEREMFVVGERSEESARIIRQLREQVATLTGRVKYLESVIAALLALLDTLEK